MKTKVQRKVNKSSTMTTKCGFVKRSYKSNMILCFVILLNLADSLLCKEVNNEGFQKNANESLIEARELFAETSSPWSWSQILEDYVLSQSSSVRNSKDLPFMSNGVQNDMFGSSSAVHQMAGGTSYGPMQNPQPPLSYHSSAYKRYIPTNNPGVFITKRIGEAVELEPHMRPPIKVVNPQFRPMTNQMLHHQQHHQQQQQQQQQQQPSLLQSIFGFGNGPSANGPTTQQQQQHTQQQRPISTQQQQHHSLPVSGTQTFRAVSENDLYLLGAIEKLVYRVDYLESRIRRSEQLIYYLMAGNNQKEVRDPCPTNFTRISDNCYHINSQAQVNWKTANSACKALNAHLAEFEKPSENEEIIAYLLNQPNYRGRDYWVGGLNPGLLWIWSNSAKPVNPNMNLTSIAMSQKHEENEDASNTIAADDEKKETADPVANETVSNDAMEIMGQGRCLRLSYNTSKHAYKYFGQECTSRHNYICEFEDKTLDNKIKKIARDLNLFDSV